MRQSNTVTATTIATLSTKISSRVRSVMAVRSRLAEAALEIKDRTRLETVRVTRVPSPGLCEISTRTLPCSKAWAAPRRRRAPGGAIVVRTRSGPS